MTTCRFILLTVTACAAYGLATAKASKTHRLTQAPASIDNTPAHILGWLPGPDKNRVCSGRYLEPTVVFKTPHPRPIGQDSTSVTANGPTLFKANGRSELQSHVVVKQPGRLLTADKAFIDRDGRSGKITAIELQGHVRYQQSGRLLVGQSAKIDFTQHMITLNSVLYHMHYPMTSGDAVDAWGRAGHVTKLASGIVKLSKGVTYTTCPPKNPAWIMSGSRLQLDHKKGVGTAHNVVLRFHRVPLFFTPYYSFPLDGRRKSGLLAPTFGLSAETGFDMSVPFYWNMAPNYDMTITPRIITKRGFQLNVLTRYLTQHSSGHLFVSDLPGDRLFSGFKNNVLSSYPETVVNQPYLNAMRSTNNNRWMLGYSNHSDWGSRWSSDVNLNRVSDDYYLRNFDITADGFVANQLLNEADIKYSGTHWNWWGLSQVYQTLHPIDQAVTQDQYQRLPAIKFSTSYPGLLKNLNASMDGEAVNFGFGSGFVAEKPIGQRFHFEPGVTLPVSWASAYVTPGLFISNTDYLVRHPNAGQVSSAARSLPIADVTAGAYFDKSFHLFNHDYVETLEPKLFYLVVPYQNQDDLPNYDTILLPFTYDSLFATNQFTGYDRQQNANQLSMGVTTRFLDANTGAERLRLSVGGMVYFVKPKVCLTPGCTAVSNRLSPIVSDATFFANRHWSGAANWAWDPNVDHTNNVLFNVDYSSDKNRVASLGYEFINENDAPQYSRLDAGVAWPLSPHWSAMAYGYYNISEKRPDSYYAGFQYDTCCWALRLVAQRNYVGNAILNDKNQYQTSYYVQLQLKGLGAVGNQNSGGLLQGTLPGYNDTMR